MGLLSRILSVVISPWLMIIEWIWKPWRLVVACQQQGITGFSFIPFVGQLPQIHRALTRPQSGNHGVWEVLRSVQQCVQQHGKVFYFTTGKTVRICMSDPDLLKDILTNNSGCYAKPSFIHVLGILGDGLFSSSGEVWAPQRKLLGLSFANKEIKPEVAHIVSIARFAVEQWLQEINSNSGELNIYHKLLQLTLNGINYIAFGGNAAEEGSASLITGAYDRYLHNCRELVFGPPAAVPGYRFLPTSTNGEITMDQKWLSGVADELIEARSRAYASSSSAELRDHKDVLDLLISAAQDGSKELNRQQLRDNCLTILLAGHHTTASLVAWTMYMLALQPQWQEKARAEVEDLLRGAGGEVGWSTLSSMKTTTMILHETLRFFPPIPLIGRLCLKENSVGRYTIPAGVEILIPTAVIHRDKELWGDDADQFLPTRFANGISKACKHVMGYLPFGSGPRTCIGQTLAMAEAKALLAVILPAFTWKLGPGYRHSPDISLTLQPKFDIPLTIEKL
ncbi:unnamed protein product [Calypogeia fissa]